MKLLFLSQNWFASELREAGHEVVTAAFQQGCDVLLDIPLIHVDRIIEEHFKNGPPDAIVVFDNSAPIMVQGLDETDIPTLFLSVDTHHHAEMHSYLAHVFDEVLISQKDCSEPFKVQGFSPIWFPLWASCHIEPSTEKKYQAVFVGTLNQELNPDRVKFFEALKLKAPIHVQSGWFPDIFPFSELVVNQTVKGDLNFRVFEAMMSGAALLTERSGNGLFELFTEGTHLLTYTKNSVDEAADKILTALSDLPALRRIGEAGRAEILAKHTPRHRAVTLLDRIVRLKKRRDSPLRFFSTMLNFVSLATKAQKKNSTLAANAYLAAMKAAQLALLHNEKLTKELACYAIVGCIGYEQFLRTGAAETFLFELADRFPDLEELALARIRTLVNRGNMDGAEPFAKKLSSQPPTEIYSRSDYFVTDLLNAVVGQS